MMRWFLFFGLVASALWAVGLDSSTFAAISSTGNISPSDPNSWTSSTNARVGNTANGTVTVDGGTLTSGSASIGYSSGISGSVSISGTSSIWTNSSALYAGYSGSGTLNIRNGGSVTDTTGYVGFNSGSTGTVTVSDAGSTWNNSGNLFVGYSGSGTVTQNAGNVNVGGVLFLAYKSGSQGTYNLNGGTLSVAGLGAVAGTSILNFSGGTLAASNDFSINVSTTLSNTATIDTQGHNVTWNSVLSGDGALAKTGAGTLTLTGANSYGGGTTISGGTLAFSNNGNLGDASGGLTFNGGTLQWNAACNLDRTVTLNAGGGTLNTNGYNATLSGEISGAGALAKTGSGTLTLTGANSYGGGTTISGGTLAFSNNGNLGNASGGLTFNGGTLQWNAACNLDRTVTLNTGGGTLNTNGYDATLSGKIGGAGSLTKTGAGTLTLAGTNSYTGDTNVNSGTLALSGGSVSDTSGYVGKDSGSIATVTVSDSGSTWTNSSALYAGYSGSGTLNIRNGGRVTDSSSYIGTWTGSTGSVDVSDSGSTWTNSGALNAGYSGSGTLNIRNGGSVTDTTGYVGFNSGSTGTVTVSDAGSTWNNSGNLFVGYSGSGTVTQNAGNVNVGGVLFLAYKSGSQGTYNLNGGTLSVAGLGAVAGTSILNFSGGTLAASNDFSINVSTTLSNTATIDTQGHNVTWNSVLSGDGALAKTGAGTLTLTGANSYGGGTTISGGTLAFSNNGNLGDASGGLTFNGGTLQWNAACNLDRTVTLNAGGGTLNTNGYNATLSGEISGAGALAKTGSGTLTLTGANSYGGGTTISGGTLAFSNNGNLGNASGGLTFNGGTLQWNAACNLDRTVTLNTGGGTLNTNGYDATLSGKIGGAGSLTKTGAGTLTLAGTNSYTGDTNVNSGTLALSGGSVSDTSGYVGKDSGSIATVTVSDSGSTWTNSSALYAGYSGSGTLNIRNGGRVTDSSSYIGTWTGSTGSVDVSDSGSTWTNSGALNAGYSGSGTLNIRNGGSVTDTTGYVGFNSGSTGTVTVSDAGSTWNNSGNLFVGYSGSGTVTQNAGNVNVGGVLFLAYKSGSQGTYNLNGGTLSVAGLGAVAGTSILNFSGGTLAASNDFSINVSTTLSNTATIDTQGHNVTWNSVLSGDGALAKTGAGTLTLTAANTYSGDTIVNGGILALNGGRVSNSTGYVGSSSGSTGEVTVSGAGSTWSNSGTLYVGYQGSGTVTQNGGNVNVGGALRLADQSGSQGTYNLNGGTLSVGEISAGAGTSTFNFNGGTLAAKDDFSTNVNATLSNTVTIDTQGHSVTWKGVLSGNGVLLKAGEGTLTLTAANAYTGDTIINGGILALNGGDTTSSTGPGEVSSSSSTWKNLHVGYSGSGSLTIRDGDSVADANSFIGTWAGSTGAVEVSDSGSTWKNTYQVVVGYEGAGSLAIRNGGSVLDSFGYIGCHAGSNGEVTVSGSDSTWTSSNDLYVGYDGSGTLTISGGSVTDSNSFIGTGAGSTGAVEVSGSGSTLNNTYQVVVGYDGAGSLSIRNGGNVTNSTGYVGNNAGSTGEVTISDTGSTWNNSGNLFVGYGGSGTVTQNDGSVNVGGMLRLADQSGSQGTYNLYGGTLSVGGLSAGAGSSTFNFSGGTLAASNDFATNVNATLSNTATIDTQGHSITWNGVLSGDGSLVKTGDGTLILLRDNEYTGDTNVSEGKLVVNGRMASNLTVALDAELGGVGTVANLVSYGTVSPGNSLNVLNVSGNYTQNSGSTLKIETDADGNCDVLNVGGTALIDGGTVSVVTTGGCKTGTQYTFLTAGTLTVVTAADITIESAFLSATLGYDDSDMWFMLASNGRNYVDEAHTRNQYDVASYLDAHKSGATSDFADILDALNLQTGDGARTAFDSMSGEIYGGLATISIENNERFLRSIAQRMQTYSMTQGLDFADNRADQSPVYVNRMTSSLDRLADRMAGWTSWVESYGVGASVANNGNASGLGYSTGGLTVGMERQLDERTLLGFAGGYANSHTALQSRSDGAEIDGGQFSVYVHREYGDRYLTGVAGYGHNSFDVGRSIEVGDIERTANSSYGGNNYSTYAEMGRNIHGRYTHWQPFAALEYIGVRQDSFTETGADSVDLDVDGMNANAFRSLLGTRLLTYFHTQSDKLLTWNASASWRHEFLDDGRVLDATFGGMTGSAFAVSGINVDRDAAIVGTGLNYAVSSHCSLYANYDLVFSRNYAANAGLGGFQYTW